MLKLQKHIAIELTILLVLILGCPIAWAETVEYDGLIEPSEVVEIGAPAEGVVDKVAVERSSTVKEGQVLVQLESSVERATLKKAKAMAAFHGEINLQKAQLAHAKRAHERVSTLRGISAHEKDQAATEISVTRHRLAKARENRSMAQLELAKSEAMLAKRLIKSPISGVVVERYVSPGEFVNNQPLIRVAKIDPLRVEVIVPASMFGRIRTGMTAAIVPELPEYGQQTATVAIVDKVIDPASSTFGVRLELPNPDSQMPSGLKCVVRFNVNAAQANKTLKHRAPAHARN